MIDEERDELLARLVDGQALPGDEEALAADSGLRDELELHRALRSRLAIVPDPPGPDVRDALIGRALDELAPVALDTDTEEKSDRTVRSLHGRRPAPKGAWMAAAAVLVAVAIGLLSLTERSRSEQFMAGEEAESLAVADEMADEEASAEAGDMMGAMAEEDDSADSAAALEREAVDGDAGFVWPPELDGCAGDLEGLIPIGGDIRFIDDGPTGLLVELTDPAQPGAPRFVQVDSSTCEITEVDDADR